MSGLSIDDDPNMGSSVEEGIWAMLPSGRRGVGTLGGRGIPSIDLLILLLDRAGPFG